MKSLSFIVNPVSGGKTKDAFSAALKKHLRKDLNYSIIHSEHEGHCRDLARQEMKKADIIIAVGGDGTINEVAGELAGSEKTLGIIPWGSGNGLARSLNIPMDLHQAIHVLNNQHVEYIDAAALNGNLFFNMAGVGFDAEVSSRFSRAGTRGLGTYISSTIETLNDYKPFRYLMNIDGKEFRDEAFLISIANSSQYGNNVHIAPDADPSDGLLDICIMNPFPWYFAPEAIIRMIGKTIDQFPYMHIIKGRKISIETERKELTHLDGEPGQNTNEISIQIKPAILKVIRGKTSNN